MQASHDLSSIPLPQPRDHGGEALYGWPPIYPLALKLFGGGYSGARLLNVLLLLIGTLLVGGIAWRAIGVGAGVTAGALYAFSPAVFSAHLSVLAEPLYLVLAMAALALIADRRGTLGGFVAAAAVLTRYAGLPLIVCGAVLLRGRERLKFLATSLTVYLAWMARNELAAGETTGRVLRWHPRSWPEMDAGLHQLMYLFVTSGHLPSIRLSQAGLVAQLVATSALVVAVVRADRRNPPPIVTASLVYAGLYCALLAITVVLFGATTPLDERLLVPLVPPFVLTVAWLVRAMPIVAVTLICVFGVTVLQQARTVTLFGTDYSGKIWSPARIDKASLPALPLYSNWPGAVAYFTGRSPQRLPRRTDPFTLDTNGDYDREVSRLAIAVRTGRAALVVFDNDFLQIPRSGIPITETPAFRNACRPVTPIVKVCVSR